MQSETAEVMIRTLYVVLLGIVMFVRYRKVAWKSLRVIEQDALLALDLP